MSTVEKGNIFEEKSLAIIKKLIEDESLPLLEKYIKIRPKQKYPSRIRNGNVSFDLAIEVWPPNATNYSMIYFIECKDYKIRIPIDRVKKFYADITEVAGVNTKAIFISNSPFQKGAFTFAESVGMMIIQADSAENFKIILHKRNGQVENKIQILKDSVNEILIDTGIASLEKIIDKQILQSFIFNKSNVGYGIDLFRKEDIEKIAIEELDKLGTDYMINAYGLDSKTIIEYLYKEYGIQVRTSYTMNEILGSCDIENKIITINIKIVATKRYLFVLCHEFGHFILHQKLLIDQFTYDSFSDSEYNFRTQKNSLINPRHWIEWQANHFSISFLLPKTSILAKLWQYQGRKNLQHGILYFDDQYSNQKNFQEFIKRLSDHFEVSKTSIIYRLQEMQYYKNNSRIKSVGQLINDYKSEYYL